MLFCLLDPLIKGHLEIQCEACRLQAPPQPRDPELVRHDLWTCVINWVVFTETFLHRCPAFALLSLCLLSSLPQMLSLCGLSPPNNNYNRTPYRSLYGKSFACPQLCHRVTYATSLSRAQGRLRNMILATKVLHVQYAHIFLLFIFFARLSLSDRGRHMWVL